MLEPSPPSVFAHFLHGAWGPHPHALPLDSLRSLAAAAGALEGRLGVHFAHRTCWSLRRHQSLPTLFTARGDPTPTRCRSTRFARSPRPQAFLKVYSACTSHTAHAGAFAAISLCPLSSRRVGTPPPRAAAQLASLARRGRRRS